MHGAEFGVFVGAVDYVDALLRKGGLPEPPEESQVEGRLDDLITLYLLRTVPCHVMRCHVMFLVVAVMR